MRTITTIIAAVLLASTISVDAAPKKTRKSRVTTPVEMIGDVAITAKAWLVADERGTMLGGNNIDAVRSIASITKLMTVMTVLDSGASLREVLPVQLHNSSVTRQQLIEHAMIRSDNTAAQLLCETHPEGYHRCIIEMNRKAQQLGMNNTLFVEPTGIMNANVSTAVDLVKLVTAAVDYEPIRVASNTPHLEVGATRKSWLSSNTNPYVGRGIDFIVSKTGTIRAAGGCIVMMLQTTNGIRTVILLGSEHVRNRVTEALALANRY